MLNEVVTGFDELTSNWASLQKEAEKTLKESNAVIAEMAAAEEELDAWLEKRSRKQEDTGST